MRTADNYMRRMRVAVTLRRRRGRRRKRGRVNERRQIRGPGLLRRQKGRTKRMTWRQYYLGRGRSSGGTSKTPRTIDYERVVALPRTIRWDVERGTIASAVESRLIAVTVRATSSNRTVFNTYFLSRGTRPRRCLLLNHG